MPTWTLEQWKDFWQVAAWIMAVGGGSIAAWKAISEIRLARLQRARDLAWAQAREAFALLDRMSSDPQLRVVTKMLDYSKGVYALSPTEEVEITRAEVLHALRTSKLQFSDKEYFIRDSFDAFFTFLDRVQMAIDLGMVTSAQITPALDYYAAIMARQPSAYVSFLRRYGYERALRLLRTLPEWLLKVPDQEALNGYNEKTESQDSSVAVQDTQTSASAKEER